MRWILKANVEGHGPKMFTTLAEDSATAAETIVQFIKMKYGAACDILENKPKEHGKG